MGESGSGRVPPFTPGRRLTPVTPAFGAPATPPASLRPPTPAFVPSARLGGFGGEVDTPIETTRRATPVARAATPASQPSAAPASSGAPSSSGASAASGASAPRRPINPFLSNDPNQKARRLARALVSDMVAYHPQKREEGARNGTLKQLFREEIKKSYEEYVEQVGREFAESTTHFQEALNDVLAGGKRIF